MAITATNEFWLAHYATVKRVPAGVFESGLRVYRSDPDGITMQWRVRAKDGAPGAGTIAQGILTIAEARELALYVLGNFGTLSDIDKLQQAFEQSP